MTIRLSSALTLASFATLTTLGPTAAADEPATGQIAVLPDAIKWAAAPPALPAGARAAVLEGDPTKPGLFTMRLQLPANYVIPPHRHPEAERVTVISGSVSVGFGDKIDKVDRKKSTAFKAGSFYINPAGAVHFVWTKEPATLQITGVGPWQLNYADPQDDPRKAKKS